MRKQTKKWKMKSGEKIRLCDMTDSHLLNTMRLLEKVGEARRRANLQEMLSCPPPGGEMAAMDYDNCLDQAMDATWGCFVPDIYWNLREEMDRRKC